MNNLTADDHAVIIWEMNWKIDFLAKKINRLENRQLIEHSDVRDRQITAYATAMGQREDIIDKLQGDAQ